MTGATPLDRAAACVESMRVGETWRFRSSPSGGETVYASCFAAMTWRYAGWLDARTSATDRREWADYLNAFQDPATGYYMVPEIISHPLSSDAHDREHLLMHACAHVLPALDALGARPRHPLTFAARFLDRTTLDRWLSERDWAKAWIEGNNLLFVGQFLVHMAEQEGRPEALASVHHLLDWLDMEMDHQTGLWGTNGFCSLHDALYGGYHQLLLYFYLQRPVLHADALIRSVLSMQHFDGGFHRYRGGGTCQDVDAIDVLVNIYKRHVSGRRQIRRALRRARHEVRGRQLANGGFVDRRDQAFTHMGMEATGAAAGEANMFSTWFGVHTLLLLDEILTRRASASRATTFNRVCSMGWHDTRLRSADALSPVEAVRDELEIRVRHVVVALYEWFDALRSRTRRPAARPGSASETSLGVEL